MDEQVGQIKKKVEEFKYLLIIPIVFYTSDNGPETHKEVREKEIPYGRARGVTNGLRGRKRSLRWRH